MINVLHPGMYSTIQDMGRIGYRKYGVPVSGAMDSISANYTNALLNNQRNDAVMEITMIGPKLKFKATTDIVISGAEMSAKINNVPILNYKVYAINENDILSFGKLIKGVRCYLGVKNGFQTTSVLKSRSFYSNITAEMIIKKDDIIPFKHQKSKTTANKGLIKPNTHFFDTDQLHVYKGPDFELFTLNEQCKLLSTLNTVTPNNNRMGYRFKENMVKHSISMLTSPVIPGTVQLMPSGNLIVLMKDAQTTGGYPRVFQLTEKSIAILAQKKANDKVRFMTI